MNPLNYSLPPYESIPPFTAQEYQRMQATKKTVLFHNLILDISNFNHPGYNSLLNPYIAKDLYQPYASKSHSLNADLLVCQLTVGRLEDSALEAEGKQFYNNLRNNEKVRKHQEVVSKYDPSLPLLEWIKKLKSE